MSEIIGKVDGIFVAEASRQPMRSVPNAEAIVNAGLEGDHHEDLSFIAKEAIATANHASNADYEPIHTRRNIITSGISDLVSLGYGRLLVGTVILDLTSLCPPCNIPSRLSGKPNFAVVFSVHNSGVRAVTTRGGWIAVGDDIILLPS